MKKFTLIGILILFLAGCSANAGDMTPTLESVPTETQVTPSPEPIALPTPTPTAASTPTPLPYLTEECRTISQVREHESSGVFALWSLYDNELFLAKADGAPRVTIQNIEYWSSAVSPDRTKFAYIQQTPRELIIASADGQILQTYTIPDNWGWLISWVTENQIFFEKRDYLGENRLEPGQLISFDLETGEFVEIRPDFPDVVLWVENYPHWFGNMTFIPNSALDTAIYAVQAGGLVLWDLETQTEIMRIYDLPNPNNLPVWNQKGEWLIVNFPIAYEHRGEEYVNWEDELPDNSGEDLFLISTDGETQRLTYFSTQSYSLFTGMSLSPDETKLAFWIDTDWERRDPNWQLGVLDIPSGNVTLYCFSAGSVEFPEVPIWSPDGESLLVTKYQGDEFNYYLNPETFVINLAANEVFSLRNWVIGFEWLMIEGQ